MASSRSSRVCDAHQIVSPSFTVSLSCSKFRIFKPRVKRKTREAESSGSEQEATRKNEIDGEDKVKRDLAVQAALASGELSTGVYRGLGAYKQPILPSENKIATAKFTGALGPNRSASNLRVTSRFDYQADICKDYKETGYCGFGDSCKFMHDRSDYKSGWQIDKEWEQSRKKVKVAEEAKEEKKFPKIIILCH